MKYLKTFNTKAQYKSAKKNHLLQLPNVSMELEHHKVFTRPAFVKKEYAEAGDIIVYSKEAYEAWTNTESGSTAEEAAYQTLLNSTAYMRPEYFDATTAQKYLPDAIVAVPYSHTGDGTVRAMSLRYMSTTNPENGSITDTSCIWGASVDIVGIPYYAGAAILVNPELGEESTLSSGNNTALPGDNFGALEVPGTDGDFGWRYTTGKHTPCPYRVDGSLNRQYLGEYGINSRLTSNCLGDMDGLSNTKAIINTLEKTYINDTLFNTTITNAQTQTVNGVSTNIFPAAMCCQRYKTVLKPNAISYDSASDTYTYGDWYLPSAGELGYVTVNRGVISYALERINNALPNTAITWVYVYYYSSSCQSKTQAWPITTFDGIVNYWGTKAANQRVHAFAKY